MDKVLRPPNVCMVFCREQRNEVAARNPNDSNKKIKGKKAMKCLVNNEAFVLIVVFWVVTSCSLVDKAWSIYI